MPEEATPLSVDFSTADIEDGPVLKVTPNRLVVEYVDWQARPVRLLFGDVAGLKWQHLDAASSDHRDDSVYEIMSSSWLGEYLSSGEWSSADGLRHFRLCFSAVGVLDVLARSMLASGAAV
jgi:hypothetical protein